MVDAEACASIDEVFRAAEAGQTDYAVVPVENSTEGAVGRTLDLMCQTPLTIVGEVKLRIGQHLLVNRAAGTTLADVTSISFLVSENPNALVASYKIPAGTVPSVANRIKMAKTSNVIVVVEAGGKLYSATKEVKVTVGGCGG